MKISGKNYIDTGVITLISLVLIFYIFGVFIPKTLGQPTYEIKMYDANGLIVGSPVFLSGHIIGHVSKVKLVDNQTYITFVLDDKLIKKLPPNCELSVKSAGMAGSRSIDIYQFPTKQDMDLKIRETIRPSKVNEVQVAMSKQVINSANSMSTMLPEKKLRELKYFMRDGIVTEKYITIVDRITELESELQINVNKNLKNFGKNLERKNNANFRK